MTKKEILLEKQQDLLLHAIQFSILILVAIALVIATISVSDADFQQKSADQDRYCQMVRRHYETRGMAGWPDYKGNAKQRCFAGQTVSEVKW